MRGRVCITFAGHVVLAGCGEASAAMAVDGCDPELVPALRSQVRQNHILWKGLKRTTNNHQLGTKKQRFTIENVSPDAAWNCPHQTSARLVEIPQLVTGRENVKASELDKWDGKTIEKEKSCRKAGKTDQPSGTDQPSYLQTGGVSVEETQKPLQNKPQIGFPENPWACELARPSHGY